VYNSSKIKKTDESKFLDQFNTINFSKKIILVTCHRRENFGKPFEEICDALLEIAHSHTETVEIVYPVHLNPNIKEVAHQKLIAPLHL
jgi:UDP-N-acetylglucosamine 2-epimerase (non-hydrolysing)